MSQTSSPVAAPVGLKLRTPTAPEQAVIARITAQRARIYERRSQRAQQRAVLRTKQGLPPDASSALRVVVFAKQHPLALAAIAGVAVVAGPKRLMRWAGVVLPLLLRLRAQR
jgi:hypothetical protein